MMTMRVLPGAAIMLLSVLSSCGDKGPQDDVADVRACYEGYFMALRNAEGPVAAELVDSRTVAYYDSMLVLARRADSAQVAGLPMMDRVTVLGMRYHGTSVVPATMNGRSALSLAVDKGLLAVNGVDGLELGTVSVDGDFAKAPLIMNGFPTPAAFHFYREEGRWRIDITSLFGLSRMALDHLSMSHGGTADALLMELLTGSAGAELPPNIWHPSR